MSLDEQTRSRIDSIIESKDVVLFMKGTPQQPQCGFSATVTGILNGIIPDYATVDVLADQEIREGIKTYSQWPTIPQLYINKEFVGGCDVIKQMYDSGDLHTALGKQPAELIVPSISLSDAAAEVIRNACQQNPNAAVHLRVDATWNHEFSLNPASGNEVVANANGIEILMDRDSASRADGLEIDLVESLQGGGFSIHNPNAPAPVGQMEVETLKEKLDSNESLELIDVREIHERERANIEGSKLLDQAMADYLDSLPKDTQLVFHCHSGMRSQQAAEYFRGRGFTNTHNLVGGIDAWSDRIDPTVPKY